MEGRYKIKYLESFNIDLLQTADYIANVLGNIDASSRLVIRIENAIFKRAENPLAFEPVKSNRDRKHPYYRIYVGNCIVFYVVIDDVMEVRRLVYRSRNIRERL